MLKRIITDGQNTYAPMNPNSSQPDEQKLNSLLNAWQLDEELPPGFAQSVWRKIDRETESRPWTWLEKLFSRPALVWGYVLLFGALGLFSGLQTARTKSDQLERNLKEQYVRTVNPYIASRSHR